MGVKATEKEMNSPKEGENRKFRNSSVLNVPKIVICCEQKPCVS